jgi:unsaturated rhamnogalacturonyl hydrolase
LAPAWAALLLYEVRPKAEYLEQVRAAVDFATRRACRSGGALAHLPGQVWDDTLAMAAPLLARSAAVLRRPELLDAAADEVVAHAALLQASDGLWFHGWSAVRGDHMSAGRWARGNGWAALAMSEVVANLPDSHPDRRLLQGLLSEHLMALAASQDPSGLWHTLVDRTDFYLETSGSAAIAAAMLSAPLPDGLETDRIRRAGRRALAAACERVAADGTVTGVSRGTGVAPSQDVYGQVPADAIQPYGQGLWLIMAAAEPRGVPGRDRRQDWR